MGGGGGDGWELALSTKLGSVKMNFMAIREIYGPCPLYGSSEFCMGSWCLNNKNQIETALRNQVWRSHSRMCSLFGAHMNTIIYQPVAQAFFRVIQVKMTID